MNLPKSNYQTHFYFISFIAIHHLISIICVGQIVVDPRDVMEVRVVYDHVISEIYKGDIEKLSYFLSGEIKWYFLEKLFYPINILHYVLSDKSFYFTTVISKKLFAYFSFYLLAKSLNFSKFNSALGGILYLTIIFKESKNIFNLKSANMLNNYPGPKYKKVSFSNPGHAFNLAKKLNTLFNVEEFTVVKLTAGETVNEK